MWIICVVVLVVMLLAYRLLLVDRSHSRVEGVRVSEKDRKHFSGFHVAVDIDSDEVVIVGDSYHSVHREAMSHGLLSSVLIVALPGERNQVFAALVDPKPVRRRYDNASLN